ncbi:hypothetical protein AGDE_08081 [Angomonas deanei]|uniref:Dpy-30 motif containing protein, putative n=1 Tax=Angomonas deanei TaxID=59799 RepID=S9W3S1_9TRYP|nr:hypothetical protein AGDE_12168 [Angomonas deanei]EPY29262.1 hypothetical protein AGDE_10044 [Angomonas deanei]EPY34011.1 hypothetical protein AGDE_08081 [Angomonas deanei]CAD2217085.1 Dpy-30 motif containing protein, putative [Angomonas deanei]|eukprot:EPY24795.1 hypothetical protein AGDE_12168 [Angomonas deanei]
MESNYLKSTVGPILAKAVAETVVAQPGNPQEYLALYLLHYVQQERRKEEEQRKKAKADTMLRDFSEVQGQKEKAAADLIQRKFRSFRSQIEEKKQREAERLSLYEEATAEAEELLENLPELKSKGEEGENAKGATPGEPSLEERTEALEEARRAFFTEQRFIYSCLNKTLLGELKNELQQKRDIILRGVAESEKIKELEIQKEDDALDVEYDPLAREPNLPAAARQLVEDILTGTNKTKGGAPLKVNIPLVLFRTLRCVCYLLFNSTPKQTDTPEKVFQLLKPTQLATLLKAFNPVGTYYRNIPLKLETEISKYNSEFAAEEGEKEKEEPEGEPVPQPKTRQIKRVVRLMRFLFSNREYYCDLLPSSFLDEEALESDESELSDKLREEQKEAEATKEFLTELRQSISNEIKDKGTITLYALVKFVDAAARYRTARDAWVDAIRNGNDPNAANYEVPDDFEAPEDEAEDEQNEEVLLDEDGNPDYAQIQLLLHKTGEDSEERTVKVWESRDGRRRKELVEYAVGYSKKLQENDDEDDEDAE